jgi:O-methyltransferase involved in polyketide biosynthesis
MISQRLKGVPKTLLIPLWARATESKRRDAIIKDELALQMVSQIDFDFSQFEKEWATQLYVAIRTEILDKAVKGFIAKYPDAVIINLGCGLDTRFFRVDNGTIQWYDLDLPEPIRIKRQFFTASDRYHMIDKSVFDYPWIKEITIDNRPVLIIAEGLLMYFQESEVKDLMNTLVKAFPKAEMLLEMVTPAMVKANGEKAQAERFQMAATFHWGIESGKEHEKYNAAIKFIEEWNYLDYHKPRWNLIRLLALIPAYKNSYCNRIVHLVFNP